MAQPRDTTVEQVQERTRIEHRIKGIASHTVAGLIETCLADEERFICSLQELDNLSVAEAKLVVMEMKAMRKRIDPDGIWR